MTDKITIDNPEEWIAKGKTKLTLPTSTNSKSNELREKLAAIEHERWSDWQAWCHEVIRNQVGRIPRLEAVLKRWDNQILKSYDQLSDQEKASDMEQVDRYWHLIESYVQQTALEAKIGTLEDICLEAEWVNNGELDNAHEEFEAVRIKTIKSLQSQLNQGGQADE